jgi:hypothetical protein
MRLISRSIELIIKRHDKIREIELDNGRVLRLFSNQKIMTTSGEKFVKDLSEDDDIIEELS